MATQAGLVGKIGNMIHYRMGNKYYSRSVPKKFTQTKATKEKAVIFGKASSVGAQVRAGLGSVIPNPSDRKMHGRLVRDLFTWLQTQPVNPDQKMGQPQFDPYVSLNSESVNFQNRWLAGVPRVTNPAPGKLEITIPTLIPGKAFRAPEEAEEVICKIASAVTDIKSSILIGQYAKEIVFPLNDQEIAGQIISIELPMPEGSLVMTAMGLVYTQDKYQRKRIITDNAFLPAAIIHSLFV